MCFKLCFTRCCSGGKKKKKKNPLYPPQSVNHTNNTVLGYNRAQSQKTSPSWLLAMDRPLESWWMNGRCLDLDQDFLCWYNAPLRDRYTLWVCILITLLQVVFLGHVTVVFFPKIGRLLTNFFKLIEQLVDQLTNYCDFHIV